MKIPEIYKLFITEKLRIHTDSRKQTKNTLFFALKGANFDANKYAKQALENGAKYAVIDNAAYKESEQYLVVDDALATLQNLAKYHREQLAIPVIGLTGSNGKTTTKELIDTVLKRKYNTVATIGNLNNHIGVPLTLLRMTVQTELAIIEMGANHPKEIAFLCEIAQPTHGYITNFGKAHLEGFGSLEGVIKAKSELYDFITKAKGLKFINGFDVKQLELTKNDNNRIVFCDEATCDYQIKMQEVNPFVKVSFNNVSVSSQLIGHYNFNNIAAAIAIGQYFKVSDDLIAQGIANYVPDNNRSQLITQGTNKIILDAYNANPTSTAAALENFSSMKAETKTVILGDMFELGDTSVAEHQQIVNQLKKLAIEVLLVGANYAQTKSSFKTFKTFDLLKVYLANNVIDNSLVLIKGSRGMQLERVLNSL